MGWRNATINVSNSLLTADLSTIDTPDGLTYPSATFVRNGHNNTITNCYYVDAIYAYNDVTISGGIVKAYSSGNSSNAISAANDVSITGGNVEATASGDGSGINANGNITLGWTDPADRILASSYHVRSGKTLTFANLFTDAGGNLYGGTLTGTDLNALADVTLQPAATLSLAAHQAPDENYWTTFYCSHTSYQINADENACAYTAEYDGANSLTLHKLGSVIPKNTAVIIVGEDNNISLTASDETATVPTNNLHGVDVRTKKSTLGTGTFYVLSQKDDNFGFFEYTAEYMPARKAYLLVNGSAALARELTMVFGEETSIDHSSLTIDHYAGAEWYDLSGRKLNGRSAEGRLQGKKPTKKGIYVNNGHKVMVK